MKFNRILAAFLSTVCLASCADFLTEAPMTSSSEESIYSTEAGLEASAIGVYRSLTDTNYGWTKQMGEFVAYPSILIHWKDNRTAENYVQTLTCSMYATSPDNQGVYNFIYQPIYKCNRIIESLESSPVDQAFKNEIDGEMRFIRAWQYYAAVRFWGDVPLILITAKNIDETNTPRTHYAEVYKQIIKDLEFAEQNMRTPERVDAVGGMTGRPNRWAATSLKASVYMQLACLLENKEYQFFDYQNKPERDCDFSSLGINTAEDAWRLCLQTAEKVITEGPYELAASYVDLFTWGPDVTNTYTSKERIFVLQSTTESNASYLAVRSLPPYWNGKTKNNNAGRWRPMRYVPWKWGTIHGGVKWTGRGDKLTNYYKSVPDPRYDASYIHTKYTNMNTGKSQSIWPSNNCYSSAYYDPYFKKYNDPTYNVSAGYADLYLMRYAEVYLIAAEAAASLSAGKDDANWQKAMDYMEVIHARARKSVAAGKAEAAHPKMSNWKCETKEDLINAIMWERVFEMHGELHEIFDTHRRGAKFMSEWLCKPINEWLKMPEQLHKDTKDPVKNNYTYFSRSFQGRYLPEDYQKLRKSVLMAFPEHEMRNNSAISFEDQNDFYWSSLEN